MINKGYSFEDRIFSNDEAIYVNDESSSVFNIFRMLSGTVNIKDEYSENVSRLSKNYYSLPYEIITEDRPDIILDIFSDSSDELSLEELMNTLIKIKRNNKKFYENLESEFVNCIVANENKKYLESFIFLYRILEGMSYSVPLMYTAKSNDFNKSFSELKKFIGKGESEGEIAFFKKFISEIYKGEEFFGSTMDINIDEVEVEDLKSVYYQIYKEKIKEKNILSESEDDEIKVKFLGFYEFLVEIRNRYFHFLQGTWQKYTYK